MRSDVGRDLHRRGFGSLSLVGVLLCHAVRPVSNTANL